MPQRWKRKFSRQKSPETTLSLGQWSPPSHVTLKPCMSQCNQCENKSMFDEPHLIHIICAQWICRHYLQCSWADNAIFAGQSLSHKSKKTWVFIFAINYYHIILLYYYYYYHIIDCYIEITLWRKVKVASGNWKWWCLPKTWFAQNGHLLSAASEQWIHTQIATR